MTAPMFLQKICQLRDEGLISDESRVLFIDDGTVAAFGTHQELMESCSEYRKMVQLQRLEEEGGEHHNG